MACSRFGAGPLSGDSPGECGTVVTARNSLERMMMSKEAEDPIARVRRARHDISAKFDHDPRKLVEHYMELQKRHADRLITAPRLLVDTRRTE